MMIASYSGARMFDKKSNVAILNGPPMRYQSYSFLSFFLSIFTAVIAEHRFLVLDHVHSLDAVLPIEMAFFVSIYLVLCVFRAQSE